MLIILISMFMLASSLVLESTERLEFIKINHTNIAKFQLTVHEQLDHGIYLPYFLKKALLTENKLDYVEITMGHFSAPVASVLPPRGIRIMTNTPISHSLFKKVSSSFSTSMEAHNKFSIQLPSIVLYSDPDDVFCTENVLSFSRLLPCSTHSGIFTALDFNKAINKLYLGIRLKINISQHVFTSSFEAYVQYESSNPFVSLVNSRLQKCDLINNTMVVSDSQVEVDAVPRIILTDSMLRPISQNLKNVILTSNIVGGWYRQISYLLITVFAETTQNITIGGHLPKNFIPLIKQVQIMSQDKEVSYEAKWNDWRDCPNEVPSQQTFVLQIQPQNKTIHIKIPYERVMKSFEEYESTGRGGQQIMGITAIIEGQMWFTDSMTDRLPEPDFSLPFKVITFTMAIMGYFWVTLWRTFIEATKV